jgi:hypothetical protein
MNKMKLVIVMMLFLIKTQAQIVEGRYYHLQLTPALVSAQYCLDGNPNGLSLTKQTDSFSDYQLWKFERQSDGTYLIKCKAGGTKNTLTGNDEKSTTFNGCAYTGSSDGSTGQYWKLMDLAQNYLSLTNIEKGTGAFLFGSDKKIAMAISAFAGGKGRWYYYWDYGFTYGKIKTVLTDCGTTGNQYLLDFKENIWEDENKMGNWKKIGTTSGNIEFVANTLNCINKDFSKWAYNGYADNWNKTIGTAKTTISAGQATANIIVYDMCGAIWEKVNGNWVYIGSANLKIEAVNKKLYCYNKDGSKWLYNGTPDSWTKQ